MVTEYDLLTPRGLHQQYPPLANTIEVGDCWLWTGVIEHHGYGRAQLRGVLWYAHRLVWTALMGAIPEGHDIDHLCRVRACVNPDHLEVVTRRVNINRGRTGYNRKEIDGT